MKRAWMAAVVLGAALLYAVTAMSQPPERDDDRPGRPGGPPPGQRDRPQGQRGMRPPPFEPGRVLPPHLRDLLDLTDEQEQQIDQLEKEVKERLLKILTPEQKKKLRELRHRRPGRGGPQGGPDRPQHEDRRRPGGPPDGGKRLEPPDRPGRDDGDEGSR